MTIELGKGKGREVEVVDGDLTAAEMHLSSPVAQTATSTGHRQSPRAALVDPGDLSLADFPVTEPTKEIPLGPRARLGNPKE